MSYAFVTKDAATSSGGFLAATTGVDTSGANLIVLGCSTYEPETIFSLADSKSNTWTPRTIYEVVSNVQVQLFYCYAPTVGASHTFTVDGGAIHIYPSIYMAAFSGAVTTPYDTENGASASSVSTKQPGTITPSQNNELVINFVGWSVNGNTVSIDGGYTITNQIDYVAGNAFGGAMAYLIQTTAAASNPTWTGTSFTSVVATQAAFKSATVVDYVLVAN